MLRLLPGLALALLLAASTLLAPGRRARCDAADSSTAPASRPAPIRYPTKSASEREALDALADDIAGALVYTRRGRVRKVVIGQWRPVDLGPGDFARWSSDGRKLAVWQGGSVYVMSADGSGRKKLVGGADRAEGCPIDFGAGAASVIYWKKRSGFWTVRIADGKTARMRLPGRYSGAPCISLDGKRMVARWGQDLYAISVAAHTHRKYARGCSPGIGPHGRRLMSNHGDHRTLTVCNWDGSGKTRLSARTCRPDGRWDNHHWSNHADYIAAQGDGKRKEAYVLRVSANRAARITWEADVRYPDLCVTRDLAAARKEAEDATRRRRSRP
jgi:hypothetical protein